MARKFLIGQLACFGDCLYATTIAKQIKTDFPESHLTWAVSSRYKSVLALNPHIDSIWEIKSDDFYNEGWNNFEAEAKKQFKNGQFDELIFTQIGLGRRNYDGTIRSSILRGYNRPITVKVDPILRLSDIEVRNVKSFADEKQLSTYNEVILFEYSPGSGQSFVTLEFTLRVIERIVPLFDNVCFILSSPNPIQQKNLNIIDASVLSYRENAELTKYCTLLVGCSSGITWLATSDWAKKLNTLQILNRKYDLFAGVKYDLESWNISTAHVIEVTKNDVDDVANCLTTILKKSFQTAKLEFDETYRPEYFNFRAIIRAALHHNTKSFKYLLLTILHFSRRNKHLNLFCLIYYGVIEAYDFHYRKLNANL